MYENHSYTLIKHDFDEQMSLLNQDEMKEKAKVEDEKKDEEKEDPKGIPEFWLTVFKNVDLLSDMLQVSFYLFDKNGSGCRFSAVNKTIWFHLLDKFSIALSCVNLFSRKCKLKWILFWMFLLFLFNVSSPQEHDEPILKHLQDIKVYFSDPGQPMVSDDSSS